MTPRRARELLERVSPALGSLKSKGNLLDEIAWPRAVEEEFFASKCTRLPRPKYAVDRDALEDEDRRLGALAGSIEGDEPIPAFLRSAVRSAVDRNRLLLAIGTKAFGDVSREIYGGARTAFWDGPTNLDLANHLLDRLKVTGWDEAKDRAAKKMGAEELAAYLGARIAQHRPKIDVDVLLDERCTSKAIAGMTRVRIRPDATFEPWEAEALYVHEVETHAFTAQNGAAQELAPFLRAGGPRTTPTQEGLAVFAELHHHALAIPRLERLAQRVKMVEMAEDGASFIDLHRWLVDRGATPRDAYLDAVRICRGGLPEGGAPFTKDACYVAGLLQVYAFLASFVRGGFRDEIEMLVAGRIALDDVVALVELRAHGLLARPRHRPTWLTRWSTLLPYFAFTSFLESVGLGAVEKHYEELIALARAARPARA
ncbi:MAG: DUF1704 domain-containing protein [Labilithrix sp.]|nr:DUF1704 domain-containing protein [Labilithrix sp.]MCW5815703.1 DUF1704 domain-containing protein [Labilithrix sp.]